MEEDEKETEKTQQQAFKKAPEKPKIQFAAPEQKPLNLSFKSDPNRKTFTFPSKTTKIE